MLTAEKTFCLIDRYWHELWSTLNLALTMMISTPMKMIWGMINTMQIINYMTWMNMKIPQNVVMCLKTIQEISNVSIVSKGLIDKVL